MVAFSCFDLETGLGVDLIDACRPVLDANPTLRAQAKAKWLTSRHNEGEPDRREAERLRLTQVDFRFDEDGGLYLGLQMTGLAECHAETDGSAGCEVRSVWVESTELPDVLRSVACMPEPVLAWYRQNPVGFLGWTALPATERMDLALDRILGEPRN